MNKILNKKSFSASGIATILLLVAFAVTVASMSNGVGVFIFMLFFLGVVMGGGSWLVRKSNMTYQKKNYEKECVNREGFLAKDKITLIFKDAKTEINWEMFEKVIENENSICIVKETDFLGFAEYMFECKSDWLNAKNIIKQKYIQQLVSD